MTLLTAMEYLCHKWPRMCSTCRDHFPVLSSFTTYYRVCEYINTHNGQPSHGGDRKTFEVMTSTYLWGSLGSVASLLATTRYQGNPHRNHKLWNTYKTEDWVRRTPLKTGGELMCESFTVATMTWLTVMEYLCHKWPRICSTCRKQFPVLSSFMIYHRVCN
jgi:hypothetical protein